MVSESMLLAAHKHCGNNRSALLDSRECDCFHCGQVFSPSEIEEWIDEGQTALCPQCGIDRLIGVVSGYPVQDPKFFAAMHSHWFETTSKFETKT